MQWLDKALDSLRNLPGAFSAPGSESLLKAIREAVEDYYQPELTEAEKKAVNGLFGLADAAYFAVEDSEQLADGESLIDQENARKLSAALDALDELPDDRPGYTLSGPCRAQWALRRVLPFPKTPEGS